MHTVKNVNKLNILNPALLLQLSLNQHICTRYLSLKLISETSTQSS